MTRKIKHPFYQTDTSRRAAFYYAENNEFILNYSSDISPKVFFSIKGNVEKA